ncbi:unnamed protein product [Amoebophrya sp. A25]|nr:unnamed protein product [Amoebophrya sp. A25]|eukprot:GSA25T00021863001.1
MEPEALGLRTYKRQHYPNQLVSPLLNFFFFDLHTCSLNLCTTINHFMT